MKQNISKTTITTGGVTTVTETQFALGDKIAKVAHPIARAIDAVIGTDIQNCGGCKQMQKDLNGGMTVAQAVKKRVQSVL